MASENLTVCNFYEKIKNTDQKQEDINPNFAKHGIKVPFRMLIVGASGSMKTNSAIDIIQKFQGTFYHITVVCRNADEPLYKLLKQKIPSDQFDVVEIDGDELSNLPKIDEFNKKEQTLVIFDDLCLVKDQVKISEFFIRARKVSCSCMYLTQAYYKTPKEIRLNCNYIILKKIASQRDLDMILREYALNVDTDELKRLYSECTHEKLDWLMIAIENTPEKRFFHNYSLLQANYETEETKTPEKDNNPIEPKEESITGSKRKIPDTSIESSDEQAAVKRLLEKFGS